MANNVTNTNNSITSITRQARTEPFDLQVARGQIYGHQTLSLFGYQSSISTTSIPVWENATTYTYPTTASTLTCSSTSVSDVAPAAFVINGLDANFNPISETVILNGTTGVTTVNSYFRVNSLVMVAVASGQTSNVGTITVKQSSNILAQINPAIGKSQSTIYTVPAGFTFYLDWVEVNTSNSYTGSTYITYKVQTTNNKNGVTVIALQQPFVALYSANRIADPFAYQEKTDIQWQLLSSSATIAAGVIVIGKLISNGA